MQESPSYPLKVISRSLPSARANRIRISWFVVGMAFGIGCTIAMAPLAISTTPHITSAPEVPAPVAMVRPTFPDSADLVSMAALSPSSGVSVSATPIEEAPAQEVALIAPNEGAPPSDMSGDATHLDLKVGNGDTLISLLTKAGVSNDEAYTLLEAVKKIYNPRSLDIGQKIAVKLMKPDAGGKSEIHALSMPVSDTSTLEVTRTGGDNFSVKKIDAPVEQKLARSGGEIKSSLYETGQAAGLPASMLAELIAAYSYDVDFQRDIQQGDAIDVLYERMETKEGQVASYGNVLYAELILNGKSLKIYRYTDKGGRADYYNAKGESVRKALLRTPVNGARITSRFGMRSHPILGYSRMHRGVDFGAPTGTPIYAAGDGTVDFSGPKAGYGNYLRIKHNGTYSTAYGHISRFAKGISRGRSVKQGQIIAYVGSTGMATGPHLHYEILANGNQVNPSGVKFKTGTILKGTELANFRASIGKLQATVDATPKASKVAMADPAPAGGIRLISR